MNQDFDNRWRAISPYLDEALDLEGEARERWLHALEQSVPHIALELRSHLRLLAALEAENFLGAPVAVIPESSLARQRFGAYTLDVQLGCGGMGSVWLAHRSDGQFEGRAAVKLLRPALVGQPSERRFMREGNVLAHLRHPNIAHLLDAGVEAGSQPYLVLEYVPGEHIDRHCDTHELDVPARIRLFLDVLDAVAHAHSNLVVHRDIKPSNILVTEEGIVKLLDFGVAALLSPTGVHSTHHAVAALTPGYAAPEQIRGEPVTTAPDVYALGAVLFQLLARRHPFLSDGRTTAQVVRAIMEGVAPRPSELVADPKLARQLRGDLDNIIGMALSREPAERYATVNQFAADLRRHLLSEPVSAGPRSVRYLAARFVRRHRPTVVLAATLLAVLIGCTAVTTTQMLEARMQRAEAARQRDQARFEAKRAEASSNFLQMLMIRDGGSDHPLSTVNDRLQYGVELLDIHYRDDPAFAGRMLVQLAADYGENEDPHGVNELYAKAYEMGRRTHDSALMVEAQCRRAYWQMRSGIRDRLTERLDEAERLLGQLPHPDAELQAQCLLARAGVEKRRGRRDLAELLLGQVLHVLKADGTTYRLSYATALTDMAEIYFERNQVAQALRFSRLAGEMHDRNGRGGTLARIYILQYAVGALSAMGEHSAALAEQMIVNERATQLEGPGQEEVGHLANYARALLLMAQWENALEVTERALDRARRSQNRYVLAHLLLTRGWALVQLRRWSEAEASLAESASQVAEGFRNAQVSAEIESVRARLDLAQGDLESARRHVERALKLAGYHTPEPERSLARILMLASQLALTEHATEHAEKYAREALVLCESVARGPVTSADTGEALLRLSQVRLASSAAHAQVRPDLERAVRALMNATSPEHPITLEARELLTSISD